MRPLNSRAGPPQPRLVPALFLYIKKEQRTESIGQLLRLHANERVSAYFLCDPSAWMGGGCFGDSEITANRISIPIAKKVKMTRAGAVIFFLPMFPLP